MHAPRSVGATSVSGIDHGVWRAIEIYRAIGLLYAATMVRLHQDEMTRLLLAWATLAVVAAWAAWITVRHDHAPGAVAVELALSCGAVLLTLPVHTPEAIRGGATTIPGMYAAAPVAAATAARGLPGGLAAASAVAMANLVQVGRPTGGTVYNILLLYAAAAALGIALDLGRRSAAAQAQVTRLQAETAERERLARAVHDDVLQNLALIHRRGTQVGGEAAELGRLAATSERALRALMTTGQTPAATRDTADPGGGPATRGSTSAGSTTRGVCDLRAALAPLAGERVELVLPATEVCLPAARGTELVAAVGACLDNVRQHAGPQARAWVLLERLPDAVSVTVRDDGLGIEPGRLEEAEREGRLGVASCIRGRLHDLGGQATYGGGPGRGTTVRLTLPTVPGSRRTTGGGER